MHAGLATGTLKIGLLERRSVLIDSLGVSVEQWLAVSASLQERKESIV